MLKRARNEKGMAIIELIPIMIIIVLLVNFSIGFFGVIHTGILNSMAARNYAFETFRHRANLDYLRDNGAKTSYKKVGMRFHTIISDKVNDSNDDFVATGRAIDFLASHEAAGTKEIHNNKIYDVVDGARYTASDGVNPVWIRPQYGICLNSTCNSK